MSPAGVSEPRPIDEPDAEALDAYSHAVIAVAERLAPSVASTGDTADARGQRADRRGQRGALTPDGFMLTSAHVVGRAAARGRATFADGREERFEVIGRDPLSDLALLRAEGAALTPRSSVTRTASRWASSSSRSATRTGRVGRSPPAWYRGSDARSRPFEKASASSTT